MFLNLQRTGTPPRPLPRSSALPLTRSSAPPLYHTIASPPEFPPILSWLYTSGYIPPLFWRFYYTGRYLKTFFSRSSIRKIECQSSSKKIFIYFGRGFYSVLKSDELFCPQVLKLKWFKVPLNSLNFFH